MTVAVSAELDRAIEAGVERLLALQEPGGWWVGELESNVTITAEHLFFLEFMRIRDEATFGIMSELLARQHPDGLWSIYHGGEPDLNATIEAYAALRGCVGSGSLSSPRPGAASNAALEPRASSRGSGLRSSAFGPGAMCRSYRSSWHSCGRNPCTSTFACWARRAVMPLAVVMHYRPVRRLPPARAWSSSISARPTRPSQRLGRRRPSAHALRRLACQTGARVNAAHGRAVDHRSAGARRVLGRNPATMGLTLASSRARGSTPVLRKGLNSWARLPRPGRGGGETEACQSPVWDTGLAVLGLPRRGWSPEHPALAKAGTWVLGEEVRAHRLERSNAGRARRVGLRVRQRSVPRCGRRRRARARLAGSALNAPPSTRTLPLAGRHAVS